MLNVNANFVEKDQLFSEFTMAGREVGLRSVVEMRGAGGGGGET